jgi:DNA-directed RNA polymerase specialized sigma24 family protein
MVALAAAARGGDRSAWHELVDHCLPLVWSVAAAQGLGTRDCGDAVQLTWLRLLEDHGPHFTDAARLEEWLVTTSRLESQRIEVSRRSASMPGVDGAAWQSA